MKETASKENIKSFYETYHAKEILHPVTNYMQAKRIKMLRKLLENLSGRILIVGCGSFGEMEIISANCDAMGIDISQEAVDQSKERYPRFDYQVADAADLPFEDNSFDHAVCSEVIEHVPDATKALSEIHRVVKKDGTFTITTPNWVNWYGLARKASEKTFDKPCTSGNQPVDNWSTPWGLKKRLRDTGFNIRKSRGLWYYPPFGRGQKQIPHQITLPVIKALYPLELVSRRVLPWFGHMLVYQTKVTKE